MGFMVNIRFNVLVEHRHRQEVRSLLFTAILSKRPVFSFHLDSFSSVTSLKCSSKHSCSWSFGNISSIWPLGERVLHSFHFGNSEAPGGHRALAASDI